MLPRSFFVWEFKGLGVCGLACGGYGVRGLVFGAGIWGGIRYGERQDFDDGSSMWGCDKWGKYYMVINRRLKRFFIKSSEPSDHM